MTTSSLTKTRPIFKRCQALCNIYVKILKNFTSKRPASSFDDKNKYSATDRKEVFQSQSRQKEEVEKKIKKVEN
jgi:hypothetical protein